MSKEPDTSTVHRSGWILVSGEQVLATFKFKKKDPPFYFFDVIWKMENPEAVIDMINGRPSASYDEIHNDTKIVSILFPEILRWDNIMTSVDGDTLIIRDYTRRKVPWLVRFVKRFYNNLSC